jgi:hypothetical protein
LVAVSPLLNPATAPARRDLIMFVPSYSSKLVPGLAGRLPHQSAKLKFRLLNVLPLKPV